MQMASSLCMGDVTKRQVTDVKSACVANESERTFLEWSLTEVQQWIQGTSFNLRLG